MYAILEVRDGKRLENYCVLEMRALFESGKHSKAELGRLFGVSPATARKAIVGDLWKHL
jgi:hypothetical protein